MRRIHHNNKRHILKLYYQGTPPSFLIQEYGIPSSTLYSWIAKSPKSIAIAAHNDRKFRNWYSLEIATRKKEQQLAFIHRTVIKKCHSVREWKSLIASMEKKVSIFYVRLWILNVVPISITKDDARSLLLIFSNLMRISRL